MADRINCPVRCYEPDMGSGTHQSEFWIKDNQGRVVATCYRRTEAMEIVEALNAGSANDQKETRPH